MKFCKKIRIIVKTDFFPRHLITINRAVSRWSNKVWISSMDIKYGYPEREKERIKAEL